MITDVAGRAGRALDRRRRRAPGARSCCFPRARSRRARCAAARRRPRVRAARARAAGRPHRRRRADRRLGVRAGRRRRRDAVVRGAGHGFPTAAGPVPIVVALGALRPRRRRRRRCARARRGLRRVRGRDGARDVELGRSAPAPARRSASGGAASTPARRARRGDVRRRRRSSSPRSGRVNAFGDIAAERRPPRCRLPPTEADARPRSANTTIGVDRRPTPRSTRSSCLLVAQGGHDGLARAVDPAAHTRSTATRSSPRPRARSTPADRSTSGPSPSRCGRAQPIRTSAPDRP